MVTEKNGIVFEYATNSGSTSVTVSSSVNEGLDMSVTFTITTSDGSKSETVTVNREGRREKFNASDGQFKTSDNSSFNVLKKNI